MKSYYSTIVKLSSLIFNITGLNINLLKIKSFEDLVELNKIVPLFRDNGKSNYFVDSGLIDHELLMKVYLEDSYKHSRYFITVVSEDLINKYFDKLSHSIEHVVIFCDRIFSDKLIFRYIDFLISSFGRIPYHLSFEIIKKYNNNVILYVLKKNPDVFQHIKNPTQEMIDFHNLVSL